MKTVAVILNSPTALPSLNAEQTICADAGADYVDFEPDYILGDMDSIHSKKHSAKTVVLPSHKDLSDGEYAVRFAIENLGADKLLISGISGGRLDHSLGNLNIFNLAHTLGVQVVGKDKDLDVYLIDADSNSSVSFDANAGDTVSAAAYMGEAIATESGMEYPLVNQVVSSTDTLCISNVALGGKVTVSVSKGKVFVFHYLRDMRK